MNVLDLFSGLGTWSLALEQVGFETIGFCEIDKHCQKLLKQNFPGKDIWSDITKLTVNDLDLLVYDEIHLAIETMAIDVITASFPCTDISVGGKQKGLIDENGKTTRSGLWFETIRLIRDIHPKYALIENVGNLRKLGLNQVLSDLQEIGYATEFYTIRATDVGLPHQRERMYLISYPDKQRCNTRIGEERHLQIDKEWKSEGLQTERQQCESESISFCPILSDRAFSEFRSTNPNRESIVSSIRRTINGFPTKFHADSGRAGVVEDIRIIEKQLEKFRQQRIKQLGNAIIPDIAYIIGKEILKREKYENDNLRI